MLPRGDQKGVARVSLETAEAWQWVTRDFILSDGDGPDSVDMTVI